MEEKLENLKEDKLCTLVFNGANNTAFPYGQQVKLDPVIILPLKLATPRAEVSLVLIESLGQVDHLKSGE